MDIKSTVNKSIVVVVFFSSFFLPQMFAERGFRIHVALFCAAAWSSDGKSLEWSDSVRPGRRNAVPLIREREGGGVKRGASIEGGGGGG